MSLHPKKKSDLGKDWMGENRRVDIRQKPERHLIVTEGTKTEPNYFKGLKRQIDRDFPDRISIEIHGEGCNTLSLLERAREIATQDINGLQQVWLVYDKDSFPADNFDNTENRCRALSKLGDVKYTALWSNECIELWFLLHFDLHQENICRAEYYPKLTAYLQKIDRTAYKKNRDDVYEVLLPQLKDAIRNAKALEKINNKKTPSQSSPGTKVYKLFEQLVDYMKK